MSPNALRQSETFCCEMPMRSVASMTDRPRLGRAAGVLGVRRPGGQVRADWGAAVIEPLRP